MQRLSKRRFQPVWEGQSTLFSRLFVIALIVSHDHPRHVRFAQEKKLVWRERIKWIFVKKTTCFAARTGFAHDYWQGRPTNEIKTITTSLSNCRMWASHHTQRQCEQYMGIFEYLRPTLVVRRWEQIFEYSNICNHPCNPPLPCTQILWGPKFWPQNIIQRFAPTKKKRTKKKKHNPISSWKLRTDLVVFPFHLSIISRHTTNPQKNQTLRVCFWGEPELDFSHNLLWSDIFFREKKTTCPMAVCTALIPSFAFLPSWVWMFDYSLAKGKWKYSSILGGRTPTPTPHFR